MSSVVVVRSLSPVPEVSEAANPTPASYPSLVIPTGNPAVGFDGLQPVAPVSDLRQEWESATDEGTAALDSLETEASSL